MLRTALSAVAVRLWACGQQQSVVQAQRHVHSRKNSNSRHLQNDLQLLRRRRRDFELGEIGPNLFLTACRTGLKAW